MFSSRAGHPLALINTGPKKGELISLADNGNLGSDFRLAEGTIVPILDTTGNRSVEYIAGPSGSGKSTIVADLVKRYLKLHPNANALLFSRSPQEDDPAFDDVDFEQIDIDDDLVGIRFDITALRPGSLLVFDDVATVSSKRQREAVELIMMDALEVGRKYNISVIITSHLIIPNDKKFARTIMNEIQYLTVFPQSGSTHQIKYVLKQYMGLDTNAINKVLSLRSRWVRVHGRFPRFVLYQQGGYLL